MSTCYGMTALGLQESGHVLVLTVCLSRMLILRLTQVKNDGLDTSHLKSDTSQTSLHMRFYCSVR